MRLSRKLRELRQPVQYLLQRLLVSVVERKLQLNVGEAEQRERRADHLRDVVERVVRVVEERDVEEPATVLLEQRVVGEGRRVHPGATARNVPSSTPGKELAMSALAVAKQFREGSEPCRVGFSPR